MEIFDFKFPPDFLFGVATSAYQIEGAWNKDGKSDSIWDRHCHDGAGIVRNNENGDVAIDHYNRFEQDLDLIQDLGVDAYRFSISWSRLLPDGVGEVNQKGLEFYNNIINGLIKRGIKPIVTIFHWDLPAKLQEKGGWGNKEITQWFCEYADLCFRSFGDRVKYWITMNELNVFTFRGYSLGTLPPCVRDFKLAVRAAHNAMLAHGMAVKIFRQKGYEGKIGIALDLVPKIPKTDKPQDKYAAEVGNVTESFFFYDAIVKGEYSPLLIKVLQEKKYLPEDIDFSELKIISEKLDFLGVNFYGKQTVKYEKDYNRFDYRIVSDNIINVAYNGVTCEEEGYRLMMKIKEDTNGSLPIMITENGRGNPDSKSSKQAQLSDDFRIKYIQKHLAAFKKSIDNGVNIIGYMHWSMFDNFEWNQGYDYRFGLVYVDYNDNLKRIPKESYYWYKDYLLQHKNNR